MTSNPDVDLAGHSYWEGVWELTGQHRVGQFSYFHHALARVFQRYLVRGNEVCEVGCADSAWVPYLIRRGMRVTGIDYSLTGVERLQRDLARRGLTATISVADVTAPSFRPEASHHLVFSLGLIEHFRDPRAILTPMRGLLHEDGVLVTLVPNLIGFWGYLEGKLAPEILAVHVRYSPVQVDEAHARAGLVPVEPARYFGTFGPLMLNLPAFARRAPRLHRATTGAVWLFEQSVAWPLGVTLGRFSETRSFSSHILGVYRKDESNRTASRA